MAGRDCSNRDIIHALGLIEGKLDGIVKTNNAHHDRMNRIDAATNRLANRLHEVEVRQSNLITKMSIISALIAGAVALVARKFMGM